MKTIVLLAASLAISSCTSATKLTAPVGLSDAILTLPSQAVSSMSKKGRREYLASGSEDYDEKERRLHLYGDNTYEGGDADSMLFLRLFEDEEGRTIAASHSARPFADGRSPDHSDTFVFRLEDGKWVDITSSALPPNVPRDWWFRFNEKGETIPCGPYEEFSRRDGRGRAYHFGKPEGRLLWSNGSFHYKSEG